MATPRLYRVVIQVSSVEQAARYYAALFGAEGRRVSPGRHYFDVGGVVLACFDPRADGDDFDAAPAADHVYFAVADLEAVHDRASVGHGADGGAPTPITTMPWGERSFYVTDPFGNPLCFVDEGTVFTG